MDDDRIVEDLRNKQPTSARGFDGQVKPVALGFDQYVWVLRRQWVLITMFVVLGVVSAMAYLVLTPRVVVATTKLNLNVIMTEPFSSQRPASGLLDGPTEADIARSHVVAIRATEILGGDMTATEIRAASEVQSGASATVVEIVFTAPNKSEAIAGANAVANAYLGFRSDQANSRVETIVDALTEQIDALNESLNETNEVISSSPPTSSQHIQSLTQQQQVLTELDGLLSERNALRSVDTTGGLVLTDAENNTTYALPARGKSLMIGTGAGLVLGVVVAFLLNPFDRRVRTANEMSRILKAPVLTASPVRRRFFSLDRTVGLRVARERLVTDLSPGDTLLIFDTMNNGSPSQVSLQLENWLAETDRNITMVVPSTTDPAGLIAALRNATAAVVVFDRTSARTENVHWFAEEAYATNTPILGVIESPTPVVQAHRGRASTQRTTSSSK